MKHTIKRSSPVVETARLQQLYGMFDVPPSEKVDLEWQVALPLDEREWNIGLIVGPSGCGKTTVARELFGDVYCTGFEWPKDRSIIDAFPDALSLKDITILLSSVGFSSPPSWVRPFHVLSNGEQFRATLARALAEMPDLCVFDEFTSVVDRTVGRIGSAAVAKTVRRRGGKFIAVTCHDDVLEWLDPDWVYRPDINSFEWRSLRGRPKIDLTIHRVHREAWRIFARHHYLTAELSNAAKCYVAFIGEQPVAFHSYLPFVGHLPKGQHAVRGHRSVTLPDFQGVGIGNAMISTLAGVHKALGYRVFRNTGHPAEIAGAYRDKNWTMIRKPSRTGRDKRLGDRASNRLTASFEYVGPACDIETAREIDKAVA